MMPCCRFLIRAVKGASVLLSLVVLLSCASPPFPHNPSLDAELAERSRTEGLAIVTAGPQSGTLPVAYFDRKWERINCCERLGFASVVQGGKSLIAVDGSFPFSMKEIRSLESMDPNVILSRLTPNVFLLDMNGGQRLRYGFRINSAGFIAVSSDERMIAFWGQAGPAPSTGHLEQNKGLLIGSLDSTVLQKIESLPPEERDPNRDKRPETLAWSPDASELAYGNDSNILVYNLRTAVSRSIAKGTNPLWSPDGTTISYRGPNGEAMLIDPSGRSPLQIMQGRKIQHALHWSPDGRYLLLALLNDEGAVPWACLAVYRIEDGALTSIGEPGLSSLDDSGHDWILRPRP